MFKLIIEDDEGHTTVVPLVKEEITIGRKEGNTIRLTERNVSRHHARMLRSNGSVFIEDLDSYNGVKVNGGKISARTTIREGDLVEIGDYHLALQKVAEQPPPTPVSGETGSQPPPVKTPAQAKPGIPAPTTADGGTAVLRLPIDEKKAPEPGRARPIPDTQAGKLVVMTTDLAGQSFLLNRTEITIGRTEENDVSLPHRSVSSRHAKVVHDGGVYRVIDLDSANGVLVNGEEYARVDIRKNDVIELGHVKLQYLAAGSDASALQTADVTPQPAIQDPLAAAPRTLVDASQVEAKSAKGGAGKMIALVVGVLVLLGAGGFAVYHFTKTKTTEKPDTTDPTVAVAPDKGPEKPTDTPPDKGSEPVATAKTEAADYFKQGLERMKAGDFASAKSALDSCLRLDPDHSGAQVMREKVVKELEASELLAKAKESKSEENWDEALSLLNEIPSGVQASKEAATLRPEVIKKYRGFHLNRAQRFEETGKLEDAIKELDAILAVDENNYLAKKRREEYKKRLGKKVATVGKKPTKSPGKKTTSSKRGMSKKEKAEKSSELATRALRAYRSKKPSEAISLFLEAIKLTPRDCDLYRKIGTAYAETGKEKKAYNSYKNYVKFCPQGKYAPRIREILKQFDEHQQ